MKKFFSLLMCAAALVCVSCTVEEEKGWEGTQLVVTNWPENVTGIMLDPDNSTKYLNRHEAGSVMCNEYFSGNTVLTIEYDRLSDSEYNEYFGYGIRSDSEKPFKVFINGKEAENENPAALYKMNDGTEAELNANVKEFKTSFDITGIKTVTVSFENAPEKNLIQRHTLR